LGRLRHLRPGLRRSADARSGASVRPAPQVARPSAARSGAVWWAPVAPP